MASATMHSLSLRSAFAAAIATAPSRLRRAGWALLIASALAFKSFVPLLAAVAAQMQGKEVADICSIYGVRLASGHAHEHAGAHHMAHPAAGAVAAMHADAPAPTHSPPDHASHAKDHCVLSGLAVCAVIVVALWTAADWDGGTQTSASIADVAALLQDASARWLTSRIHAPPRA